MMNKEELASLVREDRVHARVYTDPEIFEIEMKRLWRRAWLFGCHESQIPNPGDFFTTTLARQPVIFSRSENGNVAALFNRCAHRGALLCNHLSGNAKVLHCPYHGWAYRSDGRLAGIPYRAAYSENFLKSEDLNLAAVPRIGRYRGFVFVSLSPAGIAFEDFIAQLGSGIDNLLDRSPNGEIHTAGLHRYKYRGNWKLQIENGVDEYHPFFSHASTVNTEGRQMRRTYGDVEGKFATSGDENPLGRGRTVFDDTTGIHRYPYGQSCLTSEDYKERLSDDLLIPEYRKILVARHGEARVKQIENETRITNAVFYPNLILRAIGNLHIRVVKPIAVNQSEVWVWPLVYDGAPDHMERGIVRYGNMHTSSSSFIQTDDLEVFERAQGGMMAQAPEWIRLARGFGRETPGKLPGELVAEGSWEAGMRAQFDYWKQVNCAE
jgi:phenylpropionate dioxygenase-like ring-hydroxylating dioxygenase large terminal subunit